MRTMIAILALALVFPAAEAQAGRRWGCNKTYQTIQSNVGWVNSCYSCHPQGSFHNKQAAGYQQRSLADLMAGLKGRQLEYQAMVAGLRELGYQQAGVASNSSAYVSGGSYTHQTGGLNDLGQAVWARPQQEVNTLAVLNMAERLATQTGQIAGQGYASAAGLGAQQLEVAQINAVRDAAVATLQAAKPSSPPQFREFRFTTSIDQSGNVQVSPQQGQAQPPQQQQFQSQAQQAGPGDFGTGQTIQASCLGCHSAEKKDGGVDLSTFALLPDAEKGAMAAAIYAAVTNPDAELRMPKGKPPLPAEQTAAFAALWAMYGSQQQTQQAPAAGGP